MPTGKGGRKECKRQNNEENFSQTPARVDKLDTFQHKRKCTTSFLTKSHNPTYTRKSYLLLQFKRRHNTRNT
eukprot:5919667-Pleurochrysis_carterae.AAC.3